MKISTKIRYGVRAMVELARTNADKPIVIQWIASQQEISQSYLEQILAKLRRANLIESHKGPGGGYILAHPPEKISLYDILIALEDKFAIMKCLLTDEKENCDRIQSCIMRLYWQRLQGVIEDFFRNTTLSDIIAEEKKLFAKTGSPKPRRLKRRNK